ncbi:MAG: hypothetical protein ACKVQA_03380 [Burkholderiales bacterium]
MNATFKSLLAAMLVAALQWAPSQALAVEQPALEVTAGQSVAHLTLQGGDYGV